MSDKSELNKEEMLESLRKMSPIGTCADFIDIDDSFGFTCKQCGACCMGRDDIILNPFDVYNGAKHLGITTQEFMEKYTHASLGSNSKIPIVLLKTGEDNWCPLLDFDVKNGCVFKCRIHDAKPGACANHPIGVVRSKDMTTGYEDIQFIKVSQCPNSKSDEQHTVKEWVSKYLDNIQEISMAHKMQGLINDFVNPRNLYGLFTVVAKADDTLHLFFNENDASSEMVKGIAEIGELVKKGIEAYMVKTISMYGDYDTSKPFIPQAQAHVKEASELYVGLKEVYDRIKEMIKAGTGEDVDEIFRKQTEALMKEEED